MDKIGSSSLEPTTYNMDKAVEKVLEENEFKDEYLLKTQLGHEIVERIKKITTNVSSSDIIINAASTIAYLLKETTVTTLYSVDRDISNMSVKLITKCIIAYAAALNETEGIRKEFELIIKGEEKRQKKLEKRKKQKK